MHNVRNRMAGEKRKGAAEAVRERRHMAAKLPDPVGSKALAKLPSTPFLLASSPPLSPEDLLIRRALTGAAIVPPLPGLALTPPKPEAPPDRAARRRAAKAAARPKRKAQKAAGTKPPPPRRKAAAEPPVSTPVSSPPLSHPDPTDKPVSRRSRSPAAKAATSRRTAAKTKSELPPRRQSRARSRPSAIEPTIVAATLPTEAQATQPPIEPTAADRTAPSSVDAVPMQGELTAVPAALAATAPAALSPAASPPIQSEPPCAPLPRGRAITRTGDGLVGRVVAWLSGLSFIPRKRRAPLPRARTTLAVEPPMTARAEPPASPADSADDSLTRRMLLQLSEENARLRRELEALRAGAASR